MTDNEEFWSSLSEANPIIEPSADIRAGTRLMYELFTSLRMDGFTTFQALEIIKGFLPRQSVDPDA